jgi:mono/diheme cytochrome c family protein
VEALCVAYQPCTSKGEMSVGVMVRLRFNRMMTLILIWGQISCVSKNAGVSSERQPTSSLERGIYIKSGTQLRLFSREELTASPLARKINIEHDPAYSGKSMAYTAIPLYEIFKGFRIDATDSVQFTCTDGFSSTMSPSRLLNSNVMGAVAYLAIELRQEHWPQIKPDDPRTPAPFYVVWLNPQKSKISNEEWPFQIAGFEVKPSIESQFPNTVPIALKKHSEKSGNENFQKIRRGYQLFTQNCFACHTLNGEGTSQLGPDLNIPFNPTEYFKPGFIEKQIRNPQSVRRWPQSKMSAFDSSMLTGQDIQAIIAYLNHMAMQKHQPD